MKQEDLEIKEFFTEVLKPEDKTGSAAFEQMWQKAELQVLARRRFRLLRYAAVLTLFLSASFVIWQQYEPKGLGQELMEWQAPTDLIFSTLEYNPASSDLWESPTKFLLETNATTTNSKQ